MKSSASYAAYLKSPKRSIKHTTYFAVYDDLLSPYRGKPITFVEVGVLGGGSLFMWREFFGPSARIIGCDVNPAAKKWEKDGFEIFIGSQSDPAFWRAFAAQVGPVDILLDDGGHTFDQQIVTVEMMLDQIRDKGLLIVEDTHTSYMNGFGPRRYSFMRYVARLVDRLNARFGALDGPHAERRFWSVRIYESIVAFVIDRKATALPSQQTDNGGADDGAQDFRFVDTTEGGALIGLARKALACLGPLATAPGIRHLRNAAALLSTSLRFKSRKYFR